MPVGVPSRSDPDKIELQMVPMIDVVFQLLIFFMLTLRIPQQEAFIETNLPRAAGAGQSTAEEDLKKEFQDILVTLVKDPAGSVKKYVNDERMYTPGQMFGKLKTFQGLNPDGRVVISCADDVPYEDLVEVISVAQAAKVSIAFANVSKAAAGPGG
jgi:biopolymer transport protein ExbD